MGSSYKHVFKPIEIRGIDFKNRVVLAPPSANHTNTDHMITHEFVDWFRQFARGGVCTIYSGNASIDITECKDEETQLDLSNENCVLPLSWYAEMAKEYDCHASLEINHNGHDTAPEVIGRAPFSSSSIISSSEISRAHRLGRDPIAPIAMDQAKIDETVEKYGEAARRMKKAGMDIVLVHGGHGNLISQFTSPLYNDRTDKYGGSTANRARFALEVLDCIRQKCGDDFVIEYRISADEIAPKGMHFPETLELIGMLKEKADIFNISAGLHSDFDMNYYDNWCQNYMMPRAFNAHYAKAVKETHPDTLVTAVGSITSIELAEHIISEGWADFTAMCRPLMADPDMPRKYAEDRPEDHRPCLRCDQCTPRLLMPRVLNCAVNPICGMTTDLPDGQVPKAEVKKRCAVVGGGPAGIVAAITLCKRGHDVVLYEKSDHLGGMLIPATAAEYKIDLAAYVKYLLGQVDKYPIDVRLNTEANTELLDSEGYDAIILALGSTPIVPDIPGLDGPNVAWVPDGENGTLDVGDKIVILGAGRTSFEAAFGFRLKDKDVTIIARGDEEHVRNKLLRDGGSKAQKVYRNAMTKGTKVLFSTNIESVCNEGVWCTDSEGNRFLVEGDSVLHAFGTKRNFDEAVTMRHCAPETDVRIVGDCKKVGGNISAAVNGGFQAALRI